MTENKIENSVPNIWKAQENTIHLYKIVIVTLTAALSAAVIFLIINYFRNPLVVFKSENQIEYYLTERKSVEIGKSQIEAFTKEFLKTLYVWNEYNSDRMKKELAPYIEQELSSKLIEGQNQKYEGDFKGKKLSQSITFVEIEVLADKVVARFERILKLDGLPLVMPTELSLVLIKGTSTRFNPMGIYITGVEEHEGSK